MKNHIAAGARASWKTHPQAEGDDERDDGFCRPRRRHRRDGGGECGLCRIISHAEAEISWKRVTEDGEKLQVYVQRVNVNGNFSIARNV